MKTISNKKPKTYWLEKLNNGNIDIYFTENVEKVTEGYEFNLYRLRTKYLPNIESRILANQSDFLKQAKIQTLKTYYLPKIEELKNELAKTDYKAIKYAEGILTQSEYEPIKNHRNSIREQIRLYENSMEVL